MEDNRPIVDERETGNQEASSPNREQTAESRLGISEALKRGIHILAISASLAGATLVYNLNIAKADTSSGGRSGRRTPAIERIDIEKVDDMSHIKKLSKRRDDLRNLWDMQGRHMDPELLGEMRGLELSLFEGVITEIQFSVLIMAEAQRNINDSVANLQNKPGRRPLEDNLQLQIERNTSIFESAIEKYKEIRLAYGSMLALDDEKDWAERLRGMADDIESLIEEFNKLQTEHNNIAEFLVDRLSIIIESIEIDLNSSE